MPTLAAASLYSLAAGLAGAAFLHIAGAPLWMQIPFGALSGIGICGCAAWAALYGRR